MAQDDTGDGSDGHVAATPKLRQPRHRVLKAGVISYNGRHVTLPCTVRDLSEGGARLTAATGAVGVPDTFELYIELDGSWAGCEVTWRRGDTVGVRFTTPITVEARKRLQVVNAPAVPHKPSLRRVPRT